ncbi:MAG: isopeptide-forming domain-containing fimbrial protein [Betaproteobacteria bacterium]|nr:MAG: isopeptide-forming domain-containing fimbrial protein [Betaproteobacteria bacterium]
MSSFAQVCAVPGKDGPLTLAGTSIVNTYYAGSGTLNAGTNSLSLGMLRTGADANGVEANTTAPAVGDMLLIIQMQGAEFNTSDDNRYGDGVGDGTIQNTTGTDPARGFLSNTNFRAGLHEYVRVSSVSGATVNFVGAGFGGGLLNQYVQDVTAGSFRQTYQVIRVPQYSSLNLTSQIVPAPWDGTTGGVVAIDVAGTLNFGTLTGGVASHIDVSRRGFRGAGSQTDGDVTVGSAAYTSTNTTQHGIKAEGISGTPAFVQTSISGARNSFVTTSAVSAASGTSYPSGDYARGAPGNAGGGGTGHNSGGGGGGNGGIGGNGGRTFSGDASRDVGGFGGATVPNSTTRLMMGGGGGASDINNAVSPGGSGGRGGGLIIVRAGSITGSGVLTADGQRGVDDNSDTGRDGAGGGGAGGTILVEANSGQSSVTASVQGGDGGNANIDSAGAPRTTGESEGPGGGGGGGSVIYNSLAAAGVPVVNTTAGSPGTSQSSLTAGLGINNIASAGVGGSSIPLPYDPDGVPGVDSGALCLPQPTVTKTTSTPASSGAIVPGTNSTYTITATFPSTSGGASGVQLFDPQLGLTTTFTQTAAATSFTAIPADCATRTTITDPVSGSNANLLAGDWFVLPGCSLAYTIPILVDATTPSGTYQNDAGVRYLDPTRSTATRLVSSDTTDVTNPAGTAITYETGSTTNVLGSNYDGNLVSNTGEDILVLPPNITVAKVVSSGGGSNSPVIYTVTVTNTGAAGSYALSDTPAFGTGVTVAAAPTCTNTSSPAAGDTTPTCTTTTGRPRPAPPWSTPTPSRSRLVWPVVPPRRPPTAP